jgi:hypothetical protein
MNHHGLNVQAPYGFRRLQPNRQESGLVPARVDPAVLLEVGGPFLEKRYYGGS